MAFPTSYCHQQPIPVDLFWLQILQPIHKERCSRHQAVGQQSVYMSHCLHLLVANENESTKKKKKKTEKQLARSHDVPIPGNLPKAHHRDTYLLTHAYRSAVHGSPATETAPMNE